MRDCRAVAVGNVKVRENLWFLTLDLEGDFEVPQPGQFVQLRMGAGTDPLLRRPFSIASFSEGRESSLNILYAPAGRWTRLLASSGEGFEMDVLGPLGKPFSPAEEDRSLLVAGGRGVAPLLYLSRRMADAGRRFISLVGARTEDDVYWNEELAGSGEVKFATEDGSLGSKGMVTDLLEKEIAGVGGRSAVYACGPMGMLRAVSKICSRAGIECQVSVETVFACGFGVCRGCVVPSTIASSPNLMACSDGPVLNAKDIDWERFSE